MEELINSIYTLLSYNGQVDREEVYKKVLELSELAYKEGFNDGANKVIEYISSKNGNKSGD